MSRIPLIPMRLHIGFLLRCFLGELKRWLFHSNWRWIMDVFSKRMSVVEMVHMWHVITRYLPIHSGHPFWQHHHLQQREHGAEKRWSPDTEVIQPDTKLAVSRQRPPSLIVSQCKQETSEVSCCATSPCQQREFEKAEIILTYRKKMVKWRMTVVRQ